jgi:hypothetical protein
MLRDAGGQQLSIRLRSPSFLRKQVPTPKTSITQAVPLSDAPDNAVRCGTSSRRWSRSALGACHQRGATDRGFRGLT